MPTDCDLNDLSPCGGVNVKRGANVEMEIRTQSDHFKCQICHVASTSGTGTLAGPKRLDMWHPTRLGKRKDGHRACAMAAWSSVSSRSHKHTDEQKTAHWHRGAGRQGQAEVGGGVKGVQGA
ncbi:unnamed protein product [Protopolystoma xenopodis]|uniref:Uncharacterized protein n=1 Tax=Protopolystoma xenopodis TaxID=117903 RepID=A0A3S5B5H6_9PLAT|nr:unnamed protein product [Protopolystoma xenopodis]